jgi:nucleotide-binding universal stress UspA family protein
MYHKILVAYNGTPESRCALHECIRLAPEPWAEIHLLSVVAPPPPPVVGDHGISMPFWTEDEMTSERKRMDDALRPGYTLLKDARLVLKDAGLSAVPHLEAGEAVDVITELVNRLRIELVILGHSRHHSWMERWWRNSTDALLIEKISCTVMIAPEPEKRPRA